MLFVLTDDLDRSELRFMPHTRQLIGDHGATFDNYFVSNSLCCPSRVTTLRGQYAHNTGVWSNSSSNGGFERAFREGIEQDTVATRLSGSGYRTALVGKYLNGYPNGVSPTYRPPGWTTFVSPSFGTPYSEYGYTLNDNGRLEFHGHRNRDYGTRVYMRRTQHFVRTAVHAHMPFFAYLAVYAPHQPATPARRDAGLFPNARVPRTAAYNQVDVDGMPRFVRDLPRFRSRRAHARSTSSTGCGSGRSKRWIGVWRGWCTPCAARGNSTTPTSCSRRTTASTSGSTVSRRGSRPRTTPTSTCRC